MKWSKIIGLSVIVCGWLLLALYARQELEVDPSYILAVPNKAHWLGTDYLGRSLVPLMITGLTNTLLISISSIFIGIIIALIVGGITSYLGDHTLSINCVALLFFALSIGCILYSFPILLSLGVFSLVGLSIQLLWIVLCFANYVLLKHASQNSPFGKLKVVVPLDFLGLKLIEIFSAIPLIFIVLAISSLISQQMSTLILLLGLTSWSHMARLIRGEVIKEKNKPYMQSAHLFGFSKSYIFSKHLLPNIISPLVPAISFGIVNIILLESALTFLGVGLPPESVSLGKLMGQYLSYPDAWWLSVFPGVVLVMLILAIHRWSGAMTFKV